MRQPCVPPWSAGLAPGLSQENWAGPHPHPHPQKHQGFLAESSLKLVINFCNENLNVTLIEVIQLCLQIQHFILSKKQ